MATATDDQIVDRVKQMVMTATGANPMSFHVNGIRPTTEGPLQLTVMFNHTPAKFNFVPFMAALQPITGNIYSNQFGEKSWTWEGQLAGVPVSVSFQIEFVQSPRE